MKAIVIGATGLVGELIVNNLINNPSVHEILVFSRRELSIHDDRLKVNLVDFDKLADWQSQISGDILFSALGTTLKSSGSKEAQYKVDHDYQLEISKAALLNGVKKLILISSVNADPNSNFFYLRMKGELEQKIALLPFNSIIILRPGPLVGIRVKPRPGERCSLFFLNLIPDLLLTPGMRPVLALKVAKTAVKASLEDLDGIRIIGPREIHLDC
jgi:uncharacterized protein YbjT (DUF2867 family)